MDVFDKKAAGRWNAWTAIAERIDNDSSKSQWDRKIYNEAKQTLGAISHLLGSDDVRDMLGNFLSAFQTYRQLNHDIDSLLYGGVKGSVRIRSLILPLCLSLIEGCYINLARSLMCCLSCSTGKNYREQKDLQPITEILKAQGFAELASIPNIGLRNAISHGGVMVKEGTTSCRVEYTFTQGNKERLYEETSSGELERLALSYLNAASGLMLALCDFFDGIGGSNSFPEIEDDFVRFMYLGFDMSDADFICLDVFESAVNSQLNYTFETTQTDDDILLEKAEELFAKMRAVCPSFESYSIAYSHPRMPGNFIRAKGSDIDEFVLRGEPKRDLLCAIFRSKDLLWFGASTEKINEFEAEYYRFPIKDTEFLKIYDVSDVSLDDRKRLKANIFIGNTRDRDDIIKASTHAIRWVEELYNPPNAAMPIVHGGMKADCVYLNVYRDLRDRNRALLENNDNFICMVEYCSKKDFRLPDTNGFIRYLYHNSEWIDERTRFLWRERKHLTQVKGAKVGRNDPCPCGVSVKTTAS